MDSPETIVCEYCGERTPSYQLVKQVPHINCPQSFILESLQGFTGSPLNGSDYICYDHEETFRIKYRLKRRNLHFNPMYFSKSFRKEPSIQQECAVCKSVCIKYVRVQTIETLSLKNFIINELRIQGIKVTRKGTGICESDVLCWNCYHTVRKKNIDSNYSPKRKAKKSSTNSILESIPEETVDNTHQVEGITETLKSCCVVCGNEKRAPWCTLNNLHRKWFEELKHHPESKLANVVIPHGECGMHGKTGRYKCAEKLRKEIRSFTLCSFCRKSLSPEKDLLTVDKDMLPVIDAWKRGKNDDTHYYVAEFHKKCFANLIEEVQSSEIEEGVEDINYDEDLPNDTIDRRKLLDDLMDECLAERITREVPIHIKTLFEAVSHTFETVTEDFHLDQPSEYELQQSLDRFCENHPFFKTHHKSKKKGKLLYSEEWDLVSRCYELDQTGSDAAENISLGEPSAKTDTLATEFFSSILKLRQHVKDASKICEMYGRYPETLSKLKLEDVIFTGVRVNTEEEDAYIPPVDPLLFNVIFFITCSDEDAKLFEKTFDPTWRKIFVEGYTKTRKPFYGSTISCVFDILHKSNSNNIYPYQVLLSDLIANTNPKELIRLLNLHRKCASPSAYDRHKSTMAASVKEYKSNGIILGLEEKLFTVIHVDNLEFYSKHARDPSKALTSSLVVGAQQPSPKDSSMVLEEGTDLHKRIGDSDDTDEDDDDDDEGQDTSFLMQSDLDETLSILDISSSSSSSEADSQCSNDFEIQAEANLSGVKSQAYDSPISFLPDLSQESTQDQMHNLTENPTENPIGVTSEMISDDLADQSEVESSQSSQISGFSQLSEDSQENCYPPILKPLTRSSSKKHEMDVDPKVPRCAGFEIKPRIKRLKLDCNSEHSETRKYVVPENVQEETRICKVEDFILTEEEKLLVEDINMSIRAHALLQMAGVKDDGEDITQVIPSFKEIEGWLQPMSPKTNTAYLDLIPGKPDTVETLVYSMSLIKELFVDKLGYKHVMVCGDGKTVSLLYKIKDDYGKAMAWLQVMLGTWHLIKDYLGVFLKKYRGAFVETLLSKFLTKGVVEAVIACRVWEKSHNYAMWMMSAFIRENVTKFLEYAASKEVDTSTLAIQIQQVVSILQVNCISEEVVESFVKNYRELKVEMNSYSSLYKEFLETGASQDDQFALFRNAIDDFQIYILAYLSIRTGNWNLRIASLKMMATRFVQSGAIVYKWLVLRHLADVTSYPTNILDRLKAGAWVSNLKDGKGKSLARGEYHERTASKDIKLEVPKQLTKKNMEVLTNYSTYGATGRRNFVREFFVERDENKFTLSKGCGKNWLAFQEKHILKFQNLLSPEEPFKVEGRLLRQPFTTVIAKENLRVRYIGRKEFGESCKDHGEEIVLSLVKPMFCNKVHKTSTEKTRLAKKELIIFPKPRTKRKSKELRKIKDKENVVEVLAAQIIKLSSGDTNNEIAISELQIQSAPPLFAQEGKKQIRNTVKSDIRSSLKETYDDAFGKFRFETNNSIYIRDSMQDIYLQPLRNKLVFASYFEQFWDVKVKVSFSISSCVIIDFDTQERPKPVPKDGLRIIRDEKLETPCDDVFVDDDVAIPVNTGSWGSFLANRHNKSQLVLYLCKKLEAIGSRLEKHQTLLVSHEGSVTKVTSVSTTKLPFLSNTHDESDTRIFFLCSLYDKNDCVIRSTDSDILFNALLNNDKLNLDERKVLLQDTSTSVGSSEYCSLNTLVELISEDPKYSLLVTRNMSPAMFIGFLHFMTGSDDISFLNGFTKYYCYTNFVKYNAEICPYDLQEYNQFFQGDLDAMQGFFSRFLVVMYCRKFSPCFEPGDLENLCSDMDRDAVFTKIRNETWHRTVVSSNPLPSASAITMHCKRLTYVMKKNGNATSADIALDAEDHGWKFTQVKGMKVLTPDWDTDENESKMNAIKHKILQNCQCEKSQCLTKQCGCNKEEKKCTKLCTCIDCKNTSSYCDSDNRSTEDDDQSEDSDENAEEETVDNDDENIEFIEEADLHNDVMLQDEFADIEFAC